MENSRTDSSPERVAVMLLLVVQRFTTLGHCQDWCFKFGSCCWGGSVNFESLLPDLLSSLSSLLKEAP